MTHFADIHEAHETMFENLLWVIDDKGTSTRMSLDDKITSVEEMSRRLMLRVEDLKRLRADQTNPVGP